MSRNRAKCALCKDVIESFHEHDYTACSCGEISIVGGNVFPGCGAKDWNNFLRVDDDDNEFKPKVVDKVQDIVTQATIIDSAFPSVSEAIEAMIKALEALPQDAMVTPITHYDYHSILLLLRRIVAHS